jgi:hypothetical protein
MCACSPTWVDSGWTAFIDLGANAGIHFDLGIFPLGASVGCVRRSLMDFTASRARNDPMREPKAWDELVGALIEICEPLLKRTATVPADHVAVRIIDALFLKSVDTLRAVRLLYRSELPIQAQTLIRILFEVRVDIELFMQACVTDQAKAAHRVLDTMMLQKIRQQRQSNFLGLTSVPEAPSREEMLNDEQQLITKYGKDTADKMRRHGFSGLSIEERAKQISLSIEYNIVYRNFSRNVHNTDYMEHLAERGVIGEERWQCYQDVRDHAALSTAIACTWRTAWFVDSMLERTYFDHLARYWIRCLSFKYWVREAAENIGAGKPPS